MCSPICRALPFIGQFRLDDVARVLPGCGLPDSGLLSIFFDGDFSAYDDARRLDRCCVIHHAGALQRTPPPCEPNDEFVLRACAAYLEPSVTLPPVEEVYIDGELPTIPAVTPIFDKSSHRSGYIRVRKKLRTLGHRLLGHPDELQGGELKLDLVRRLDRKDRFRYVDYEWTNLDELVAEMRRWRLLCQIATDPEAQMSWGDGGIVYLWIRDDDLRTGRFDRVHAEMQW